VSSVRKGTFLRYDAFSCWSNKPATADKSPAGALSARAAAARCLYFSALIRVSFPTNTVEAAIFDDTGRAEGPGGCEGMERTELGASFKGSCELEDS